VSYCLPQGYTERERPAPFADEDDGLNWQWATYLLARSAGMTRGCRTVIDLGCGRARKLKLLDFPRMFDVVLGYDCEKNVEWLRENEKWLGTRVENFDAQDLTLLAPHGSLIICADVVEHLVSPEYLLRELARLRSKRGALVVLSTPDRALCHGAQHLGPPPNIAHVREWTLDEFRALCDEHGLAGGQFSHTQTHDKSENEHTITAVFE
jgi:SAM-dependent methyltransferase